VVLEFYQLKVSVRGGVQFLPPVFCVILLAAVQNYFLPPDRSVSAPICS
jgi:hypothetical protein